ncbi:MAG: PKD domain-containing protein, partial [Bacteroidota bacterium]
LTQACSTLGQTPASAFPVCTKDTFIQTTVPICTNKKVVIPGCPPATGDYADKNPFWYRFTCYQSGTLSFLITPNDLTDDYDWQLYDITGLTDLSAVYTNASLFVVGNWSGSSGLTGASTKGKNVVECASVPADNVNTFSITPVIQQGHTYLLMISHYSDSQSGYKLSFGADGTAVINDPKLPDLQSVKPSCDATVITLKLNMKVKCSSLAADGSDFAISPAQATVIAASGGNCNSGFDMDSVTLTLSNPLPPGNYALVIKKGIDLNTLLDDCNRDIPEGHQLVFAITALQPTPLDSITPVACSPSSLQLVFKKNIRCNSIAADGSDFIISGPSPVAVKAAAGSCNNNQTSTITLTLASPLVKGGVYQVKVARGTDNNNIIDECGQETPVGSAVSFIVKDTVSANFDYQLLLGCKADTIVLAHDGRNGVNQWLWILDAAGGSTQQNTTAVFKTFGEKQITLRVSNGVCSDSITKTIMLDNTLKAAFETNNILCPEDAAEFKNNSIGKIINYNWDLGDGNTSILQVPLPENYPKTGVEKNYTVKLIVQNAANCFDTATSAIKVLKTCYIAVPNAFTPNGDGMNDYLYPLNAFKADNLDFNVY